jgi:hypothetical protein
MGFEVLTAVIMKNTISKVVPPLNLAEVYRRFKRILANFYRTIRRHIPFILVYYCYHFINKYIYRTVPIWKINIWHSALKENPVQNTRWTIRGNSITTHLAWPRKNSTAPKLVGTIEVPWWPHLEFPHLKRNQIRVAFLWASYTIAYTADSEAQSLSKWCFLRRSRILAFSDPELILIQLLEIEGSHIVTIKIMVFGMWCVAVWYIGVNVSLSRRSSSRRRRRRRRRRSS